MTTELILPTLGESIAEATLARWLKQPGETVKRGEDIAEIETAKATMPLECPANGVLLKIVVDEGVTVSTGQLLAVIGRVGETLETPAPAPQAGRLAASPGLAAAEISSSSANGERRVSPAARRMAQELGIAIDLVQPAQPGARITTEDVQRCATLRAETAELRAPFHRVDPGEVRRVVAERMSASAREIPQFFVSIDVEMTRFNAALAGLRQRLAGCGLKPSVTALLAYHLGRVLPSHPLLNARYEPDGLIVYDTVNLAIAASSERGLTVPVIYHIERLGLADITRRLVEIGEKARAGSLALSDLSDSTFTLSNLGMHGVSQNIALVNPPQSAILGAGAVRPAVLPAPDGGLRPAQLLTLTVTGDHRVLDGGVVARFLSALKSDLEACAADQVTL